MCLVGLYNAGIYPKCFFSYYLLFVIFNYIKVTPYKLSSTSQEFRQQTSNQQRTIEKCQQVTGWTWKH